MIQTCICLTGKSDRILKGCFQKQDTQLAMVRKHNISVNII